MSDDPRRAGANESGPDDADETPADATDAGTGAADDTDTSTGDGGERVTADDTGAAAEDGAEATAESGVETGTGDGAAGDGTDGDGADPGSESTADAGSRAASAEIRTSDESLLAVRGLDAGYGDLQILDGVDLDVGDGEYVTIVGPNGAGKSTVMKSVFGLTNVFGGTVQFQDRDITAEQPEEIIHHGIGYVPQNDNVFGGLSVRENLEMGAYILDDVPEDRIAAVYDRFPILEERESQRAGTLSGGQQQMLAMGRALMLDPDLLLLDEPSAGLAPDLVDDMFDRIDGINEDGTAVLMVEQNAKEALRRCDRGYVLVQGQNRFEDTGDVLLADDDVRQQFLGG